MLYNAKTRVCALTCIHAAEVTYFACISHVCDFIFVSGVSFQRPVLSTGSCSPAGSSWIEDSPFSLQMVKCSSVLSQHNTFSVSLCLHPTFSSFASSLIPTLFLSAFLPFLSLLYIPFFLHLPFLSMITFCFCFLSLPSFFFFSYPCPLQVAPFMLPLTPCLPPLTLIFPVLPSSPNHLSTFIPLSLPSCTLLQSPTSSSLSPSPVPTETQPAWHIVFTQPVTGCLCLLPLQRWGRRDGKNQPFGGFSSQLSRCCLSLNLKTLRWKIDCFGGFFVLSSF